MGVLTIGAFARAARLTPKALRLYDERGLLPPAAVDPETGYRLYDPSQLPRARLIAQLRRIGMPLAEIATVSCLPAAEAAEAITAYWERVTVNAAERAQLAVILVEHLSGRGSAMSDPNPILDVRYAAACDIGAVRHTNEDAVYASDRLLAVADGGGGPGGADASAAAIGALTAVEMTEAAATELLTMLASAVNGAHRTIREAATDSHQPITTLTAMLRRGSRLALLHVGDTRAYLLRGGELSLLTQDHTWVQSQVDAGKLDHEQAAVHPDRALLVRALGAGPEVEVDLALRTAQAGDRYLLCSDGLATVVDRAALRAELTEAGDPQQAVQRLVQLAHAQGAPDNIACVVADFVAA